MDPEDLKKLDDEEIMDEAGGPSGV